MARYCCSWCDTITERRDFRQDHGGGPEELPHRRKRVKKTTQKKPGCVGNDGGSHVYVMIKYVVENESRSWGSWYGNSRFRKVCIGCGRKDRIRYNYYPDESQVYETRYIKDIWELWS